MGFLSQIIGVIVSEGKGRGNYPEFPGIALAHESQRPVYLQAWMRRIKRNCGKYSMKEIVIDKFFGGAIMITSVIMFKLKEKKDENAAQIKEKLLGMKGQIAQLKDITVKTHLRSSPTSFDVMMIATYNSIQDFDDYVVHPVHVEAGKFVISLCEQTASVLYED
jgi:hypothetical protein